MAHTGIEYGNYKIVFVDIGEGLNGEYNPDDPDDIPLLRFDSYTLVNDDWEPIDDGSYCTQVRADAEDRVLDTLAATIAIGLADACKNGSSPKRYLERMSWISEKDI